MPSTFTDMITGIFPVNKRAALHSELERAAEETTADLQKRTADRRDRNSKTRTDMQTRAVQDACT